MEDISGRKDEHIPSHCELMEMEQANILNREHLVGNWMKSLAQTSGKPLNLDTEIPDEDEEDHIGMLERMIPHVKIHKQHTGSVFSHDNEPDDRPYQSFHERRRKMNKKKRVVKKDGLTNVTYKNISKKRRRYISDLYTTLLDSDWHWCITMFVIGFYGSWLFFGLVYYILSTIHGDFDDSLHEDWVPCITAVDGFAACFLFSLETQHTIGYGSRVTTTECPDAMIVMSVQSVLGCLIQAFMVGLVFSKLSRPRNRSKTIIFSNQAVITQRNKRLCLIIRIGDLRDDNFILGTQISAKLLRRRVTLEGELYQEMQNVKVDPETNNESCVFFVWPLDIVHVIDKDSPFYDMSFADLAKERFELLIIMEGTNETSNMTFQARTSFLPNEILWGQRFEQMLLYRKDNNKFQVNFSAFHSTYEVETPLCSARELQEIYNTYTRKISSLSSRLSRPSFSIKGPSERKKSQNTLVENTFEASPMSSCSRIKYRPEDDVRQTKETPRRYMNGFILGEEKESDSSPE